MKASALALFALTIGAIPAQCQDSTQNKTPVDVDGWGNIRWGMELKQVQALYPNAIPDHAEGSLLIRDFEILPKVLAKITIETDQGRRVHAVSIQPLSAAGMEIEVQPREIPRIIRASVFKDFKDLIILKYGMPKIDETKSDRGIDKTRLVWMFPSTIIELTMSQSFRFAQIGHIFLSYSVPQNNPF